ncbi:MULTISPECIES: hypothetical protein [Rhodococcus]|uniref:hypothetical protein n=1 Tax=Rhodococcus TaxID=1827 RepID=UPI00110D7F9A|nr:MULTISPECIES: hypothetical protein [Rhodococcus]MCF8786158.1 hypothetical protein [Rhodococcus ruber]UTM40264.1 hypothetical protein MX572_25495 [Rhodococcus pyridinivorans]WAL49711.1 hypothetical protein OQN32_27250 [Rhodococcus pyridinivorans]
MFTPTLTVAASALLLSAKCAPNTTFGPEDAEAFLPTRLRYTELGPKSAVVTPRQAWEELAAAGRVVGDFIAWRLVDVTTGE